LLPLATLLQAACWAVMGLMALALALSILTLCRAQMGVHRGTIELMQSLGGTDGQIAAMVARYVKRLSVPATLTGFGVALVLVGVLSALPPMMGKSRASKSAKELFAKNAGINGLAAARVALFGARDVWFVVGVPVYLYSAGWTFSMVSGFVAAWTIGYGLVQAMAPHIVKRSEDGLSSEVPAARWWSAALAVVPLALAAAVAAQVPHLVWVVVGGLSLFGFAFAVNSSVHSYLVLAYAGSEKAAEDVGF
jgi:hypothetical protein